MNAKPTLRKNARFPWGTLQPPHSQRPLAVGSSDCSFPTGVSHFSAAQCGSIIKKSITSLKMQKAYHKCRQNTKTPVGIARGEDPRKSVLCSEEAETVPTESGVFCRNEFKHTSKGSYKLLQILSLLRSKEGLL